MKNLHPELYAGLDKIIKLCIEEGLTDPETQSIVIRIQINFYLKEHGLPELPA